MAYQWVDTGTGVWVCFLLTGKDGIDGERPYLGKQQRIAVVRRDSHRLGLLFVEVAHHPDAQAFTQWPNPFEKLAQAQVFALAMWEDQAAAAVEAALKKQMPETVTRRPGEDDASLRARILDAITGLALALLLCAGCADDASGVLGSPDADPDAPGASWGPLALRRQAPRVQGPDLGVEAPPPDPGPEPAGAEPGPDAGQDVPGLEVAADLAPEAPVTNGWPGACDPVRPPAGCQCAFDCAGGARCDDGPTYMGAFCDSTWKCAPGYGCFGGACRRFCDSDAWCAAHWSAGSTCTGVVPCAPAGAGYCR